MSGSEILATISWIVAGVVLVVAVTGLARRAGWSAPLVLVACGVGAAYIPSVPDFELQPELVIAGILPALLFASAIRTSLLEVRARIDSIVTLSVLLVIFSTFAVGLVLFGLLPSIGFAAAVAFGAVVAPTDAVSVESLANGGLPRRVFSLLEGESLLNDATALVALNTAIATVAATTTTAGQVGLEFLLAVLVGIAGGVAVAFVASEIRRRLRAPVLDTSMSLITPYAAFLPANWLHGSGVLAVVTTGLWLGYRSPFLQSAEARIAERLNWRTVEFLLENAVFLLIGLQLPRIVRNTLSSGLDLWQAIGICVAVYLAMVAARFAWVMLVTAVYRFGPEVLRDRRWTWSAAVVIAFAGMRGVVTLAAVFLLPAQLIPDSGFLQLLAFVVVVVSLLQGLALGPLTRLLKLPLPSRDQDVIQIRSLIAEAQNAAIERLDTEMTDEDPDDIVDALRTNAQYRMQIGSSADGRETAEADAYSRLRLMMLQSEREAVLQARSEGRYEESAISAVLADFDSLEAALKRSYRRDLPDRPAPAPGLPSLLGRIRAMVPARPIADEPRRVLDGGADADADSAADAEEGAERAS